MLESSSSDRREESEGSRSRSGSTQGRPGRGGQRADRPRTPPHRAPPQSTSPRRSTQLHQPAQTEDFRKINLSAKPSTSRTAHSQSASEDERGRHVSRSSRDGRTKPGGRGSPCRLSCPILVLTTLLWCHIRQTSSSSLPHILSFRAGCK